MNGDTDRLDDLLALLPGLAVHEPDRGRAEMTMGRCHAALERRSRRQRGTADALAAWRRVLEPAIVGCLCAVFLVEVLARALRAYGF
jgi:hypothetical protein